MLALLGLPEVLFTALILILSVGALVFWIWMLVDCVRNRSLSDNERLIWVIVICLTHALGALVYLVAGRRPRNPIPPAATS